MNPSHLGSKAIVKTKTVPHRVSQDPRKEASGHVNFIFRRLFLCYNIQNFFHLPSQVINKGRKLDRLQATEREARERRLQATEREARERRGLHLAANHCNSETGNSGKGAGLLGQSCTLRGVNVSHPILKDNIGRPQRDKVSHMNALVSQCI